MLTTTPCRYLGQCRSNRLSCRLQPLNARSWRSLLAQLVADIAACGCFVEFVAVHTPFHSYGLLDSYDLLLHHVPMAAFALYLCGSMLRVTEEHEFRHFVDMARWNSPLCHIDVTHLALLHPREAREVCALGILMA